ncbi:hemolysin III family channel protein [Salinisphaera sp. PC39]|uniref:PAQR family membrane homeostasis protein TrhA n=1 Tax=Salinisphaera sp. PC39 TaxID=1304156 RepID=UPI003341087E
METAITAPQRIREEIANAVTHGIGVLLSIGGGATLVTLVAIYAGAREVVGSLVFVISLALLYSASTLYHAIPHPRARHHLKVLDHCAIYLLIAGTYTPFTVAALRGGLGWSLFGAVWGLALLGIVFKLFFTGRLRVLSTAAYVFMGWLAVIAFVPISRELEPAALQWLIAGGVAYTAGTFFYHNERLRYSHAVWHLFVLAGSICHFSAVVAQFVVPAVAAA